METLIKIRAVIAVACLAVFGFAQLAEARSHHPRKHVAKKAFKSRSQGVSVSTGDVTGDGTSDVAVTTKPNQKPR